MYVRNKIKFSPNYNAHTRSTTLLTYTTNRPILCKIFHAYLFSLRLPRTSLYVTLDWNHNVKPKKEKIKHKNVCTRVRKQRNEQAIKRSIKTVMCVVLNEWWAIVIAHLVDGIIRCARHTRKCRSQSHFFFFFCSFVPFFDFHFSFASRRHSFVLRICHWRQWSDRTARSFTCHSFVSLHLEMDFLYELITHSTRALGSNGADGQDAFTSQTGHRHNSIRKIQALKWHYNFTPCTGISGWQWVVVSVRVACLQSHSLTRFFFFYLSLT